MKNPKKIQIKANIIQVITFCLVLMSGQIAAQNELPGPKSNMTPVKSGSLVVGMDNTTQAAPGYFNLKAYGLVNQLLQNNIPVKWAIKAGKAKNGIDFSATAVREYPSNIATQNYNFKAGPFIIDSADAAKARTIIAAWGNKVAVYRLTQNVNVDIRYTLNFKPKVAVFNNGGNGKIQIDYLLEAGIDTSLYAKLLPELATVPPCGYTLASEAHWNDLTDTLQSHAVARFVANGGNFFAGCIAIRLYENDNKFETTGGIEIENKNMTPAYENSDLPFAQFDGDLATIGGALHNWYRNTGSNYNSKAYDVVYNTNGTAYLQAAGIKTLPNNLAGGNVFYLGGHNYGNNTNAASINGRRMYLNTLFVPPGMPVPNIVSVNDSTSLCKGTSVILSSSAAQSYTWSTGATTQSIKATASGIYTVSVTVAGNCKGNNNISVTVNPPPVITITGDTAMCPGTSAELSASGAKTYVWSNGLTTASISVNKQGSYYVTGTTNGCVSSSNIFNVAVKNTPPIVITTSTGKTSKCEEGLTLYAQSGITNLFWSTAETTTSIVVYAFGTYSVTGVNTNGCETSDSITITADCGRKMNPETNEINNNDNVVVYPNPAHGKLQIAFNANAGAYNLYMMDLIGNYVYKYSGEAQQGYNLCSVDLDKVSKGIYIISLITGEAAKTTKITVE